MSKLNKYHGVFPAFYACYDDKGEISTDRIQKYVQFLLNKGIKGLYVGGSSGECIYQTLEERKLVLETVMKVAKGKMTIIAHIGALSTMHSIELAKHAESCGVDALSSIPPIYFPLSDASVEAYWTAMVQATKLDFFIYNIPGTTNYHLPLSVYQNMLKLPQVVGVKNSSMPTLDIMTKKMYSDKEVIVFNGPDEQYISGRIMGADGGIGGTYGVMPELFLKLEELFVNKELEKAQQLQQEINFVIFDLLSGTKGHLYATAKEILKLQGCNIGEARLPLKAVDASEQGKIKEIHEKIKKIIQKYCK